MQQALDSYDKMVLSYYGISSFEAMKDINMVNHIPTEDRIEVASHLAISLIQINDHCVDNFRIFPKSKAEEYNEVAMSGCCGSSDGEVTCKSGEIYLVGFNYGH